MKVDMSPKAVKGRLKLVSQLWRLSLSLGKAKKETDARRINKDISHNSVKKYKLFVRKS
ncbi:MAG: hypothetical protein ABJA66_16445 [Actinomycetota bacterium]